MGAIDWEGIISVLRKGELMKIDWKARVTNPLFWAAIASTIGAPMFTAAGLQWEDMTSWQILGDTILGAFGNPVVLIAMCINAAAVINNWNEKGLSDNPSDLVVGKHAKGE